MQTKIKSFDDLSAISGIGPARERYLRDVLRIYTYEDLAELTAVQLEMKFKESGKTVSKKNLESWIEQAKELIHATMDSSKVNEEFGARELVDKFNSSGRKNGWTPVASFLVYFQTQKMEQEILDYQTLVHYMETDCEESWPGIEINELSNWIIDQISSVVELPVGEGVKREEDAQVGQNARPQAEIKIDHVRIFQPVSADKPIYELNTEQTLLGELKSTIPFRVEVDFALTGKSARQITEQGIACTARCFQFDPQSKTSNLLAETPFLELKAGKLKYSYEIPEASLTSGEYWIFVMVSTLQTDILAPDFLKLSSLLVV